MTKDQLKVYESLTIAEMRSLVDRAKLDLADTEEYLGILRVADTVKDFELVLQQLEIKCHESTDLKPLRKALKCLKLYFAATNLKRCQRYYRCIY